MFKKGFTLIELLVVIALLGIMAAIVLAALGSAKNKGNDSSIQATMKSVANQAALYYSKNGDYGSEATTCTTGITMFTDTSSYGLSKLIAAVQAKSSSTACFATTTPSAAWVVSARLKNDSTKFWCVDSTGTSKQRTLAATSTTVLCNGY